MGCNKYSWINAVHRCRVRILETECIAAPVVSDDGSSNSRQRRVRSLGLSLARKAEGGYEEQEE